MQRLATVFAVLAAADALTCKTGGPYEGKEWGPTCNKENHVDVCVYLFGSSYGCLPKEYASHVTSEAACDKNGCWCMENDCNTKEWADEFNKTWVPPPQCWTGLAGANDGPTCSETQLFEDNKFSDPSPSCHSRTISNQCVENNKGVGMGDGCGDPAGTGDQAACESKSGDARSMDDSYDGTTKHCRWAPELTPAGKQGSCETDTACTWFADRGCHGVGGACLGQCSDSDSTDAKRSAWNLKKGTECEARVQYGCFENNDHMGGNERCSNTALNSDETSCLAVATDDCWEGLCSGSVTGTEMPCANRTSSSDCTRPAPVGSNPNLCSWKKQCCQFVPMATDLGNACLNKGKGTLDGLCGFNDGSGAPSKATVKMGFEHGIFNMHDTFESKCAVVASFRKDKGSATALGSDKVDMVGNACTRGSSGWKAVAEHVGHNSTTIDEYCANFIPDSSAKAALSKHSPATIILSVEQGQFAAVFPTLVNVKYIVTAKPEFGKCLFMADEDKWGAGICTCDNKECNGKTALDLIVDRDIGPMRLVQFIDGSLAGLKDEVNNIVPGIMDAKGKMDVANVGKVTEPDVTAIMALDGIAKLTNKAELWGIVQDYQKLLTAESDYKTNLMADPVYKALKIDASKVMAANDAAGVLLYRDDGIIYTVSLTGLADAKLDAVATATGIDKDCFKKNCPTTTTTATTTAATTTSSSGSGSASGPTPAPTSAPTPAPEQTKVTGTVAFTANGATQMQVETATKKSLASEFKVNESQVSVAATQSRRLVENVRQLAGTWSVAYTVTAPKSEKASMETKVAALITDTGSLKTVMATELKAAGADEAVANSLVVTSFAGTAVLETIPAGGPTASAFARSTGVTVVVTFVTALIVFFG